MKKLIGLYFIVLFITASAIGHWPINREIKCPVCKHTFMWKSVWSGFSPPPRSDMKPADPATGWRLPVCKKCLFVIYSESIDRNELKKCKGFIQSSKHKKILKRASFYRLGHLYQRLGRDSKDLAWVWMNASWQEEDNPVHYREDLERGLTAFRQFLREVHLNPTTDRAKQYELEEQWHTAQLMVGEILRLTEQYEDATEHFKALIKNESFLAFRYGEQVLLELEICEKRDHKPQFFGQSPHNWEVVDLWKRLLAYGADINASDTAGRTALSDAFIEKDPNGVRALIDLGANVHGPTGTGYSTLHLAIKNKDEELALFLMERGVDIHAICDNESHKGDTALLLAARYGLLQVVSNLIDRGANLNAPNKSGQTALYLAIRNKHDDVAILLIDKGVDIHCMPKKSGQTSGLGNTPLYWAAAYDRIKVVELLLRKGADVNVRNVHGRTAAHIAACNDCYQVLLLLLEHGANIHSKDQYGNTLIFAAANRRKINPELTAELVKRGAKVTPTIESLLATGKTQLQLAVEANDLDRAKELTRCEFFKKQINHPCLTLTFSPSPLETAVQMGHVEMARFLIKHGADIDASDAQGRTSVYRAAAANQLKVLQLLIDHGADIHKPQLWDETPLHHAAWRGRKEAVSLLLKHGADVHATMRNMRGGINSGFTPLHNAVYGRQSEVVKILIDHGADVNAKDANGLTPLDHAYRQGDKKTTHLLKKAGAHRSNE